MNGFLFLIFDLLGLRFAPVGGPFLNFDHQPQELPNTLQKGGGQKAPKQQKLPEIPEPKPLPPTPPPPTATAMSADEAAMDARRNEARKKGFGSTLLAGETGGGNNQKKTLLG